MIDEYVVQLATEYIDHCLEGNKQSTLVGLISYIDSRNKTIPLIEEVNAALVQRPSIFVQRNDGKVEFASTGCERSITADDLSRNFEAYHAEFWTAYKKLRDGKHQQ